MNSVAKSFFRVVGTIAGAAIAFYLGFIATGWGYNRWYLPALIRQNPHDGQIGMAAFFTSVFGGCVSGVIVFCFGILWTVRAARR